MGKHRFLRAATRLRTLCFALTDRNASMFILPSCPELPSEQSAQCLAGAMESRPYGLGSKPKQCRRSLGVDRLEVSQNEYDAKIVWKSRNALANEGAKLCTFEP